jgi:hypothetical protein
LNQSGNFDRDKLDESCCELDVELIFRVIDDPLIVFRPWNFYPPAPGARPDRRAGLCCLRGVRGSQPMQLANADGMTYWQFMRERIGAIRELPAKCQQMHFTPGVIRSAGSFL